MISIQVGYRLTALMQAKHEIHAAQALSIARKLPDNCGMKPRTLLSDRLSFCRTVPGTWLASYDALINRLRKSGATNGAPGIGDVVPDFVLPDGTGTLRRLSDLVSGGPVVLSFNRGSWCPYCQEEIGAWAEHLADLAACGGRLIIVTPEAGGRMAALGDLAGAGSVVLCDIDLGVALLMGLAFPVGPAVLQEFRTDDLDLSVINGTANGFLPVPATFVLDQNRCVHFAFVDPDFAQRAEPCDVLVAVAALTSGV